MHTHWQKIIGTNYANYVSKMNDADSMLQYAYEFGSKSRCCY